MTKQELQKEIQDKVKPGVKPSDLKKLKRSKSEGDIPKAPPLPTSTQITQLQQQVQFHAETAANYLKSLQVSQAKVNELEEKLKNNPSTNTELDQSLSARHQGLKSWWKQYEKSKKLDQELSENLDYASDELINQDQTISSLRGQINQLKLTNQSLTKDLNLATKLAELRKVPYYSPEDKGTYLKYVLYSLLAVSFTLYLANYFKNQRASPKNYV